MTNFDKALREFRKILGNSFVISDAEGIKKVNQPTFASSSQVVGVLFPGSIAQLKRILKVAVKYSVSLYPVSTGKNWGLGSSFPPKGQQVLINLGRMNKILDYSEELGFIRIEPGVTFTQVFDYLKEIGSNLMLDVTGAHGNTSIIGNSVERGHGIGMYSDRFSHVTDFRVILANGTELRTGFSRFFGENVANTSRWAVGPDLQGLFSQSPLGIVVEMTIFLQQKPKVLLPFICSVDDLNKTSKVMAVLSKLQQGGSRFSYRAFNELRLASFTKRVPEKYLNEPTPKDQSMLPSLFGLKRGWHIIGAAYADTEEESLAQKTFFKSHINSFGLLRFFPSDRPPEGDHLAGVFEDEFAEAIRKSFLGEPVKGVGMCYWRMPSSIAVSETPGNDGCGVIWVCPALACDANSVREFVLSTEKILVSHGFEPNIGLLVPSPRCINATVAIVYNRSVKGIDQRALKAHQELVNNYYKLGFPIYRHSLLSMNLVKDPQIKFISQIRKILDPKGILFKGRYS